MLVHLFPQLNVDLGLELLVMVALVMVAEWLAVSFAHGFVSGGFAVVLAVFIIYGGSAAAYVVGLSALIGGGIANRGNPIRTTLFNAAQYVLAVFGALYLYKLVGGAAADRLDAGNIIPLAVFILAYYVINHLLVYLYHLPKRSSYPLISWVDALRWDAYTYFFTIPVGLLMVLLYAETGFIGSVLLFIPVIAGQFILRLYIDLEFATRELKVLQHVSSRLAGSDPDELMDIILRESRRIVDYHTGVFYLLRQNRGYYQPVVIKSPYANEIGQMPVYPGEGFVGRVIENARPVLVEDTRQQPHLRQEPGLTRVMRSLLAVPLVSSSGVVGVIVLGSRRPKSFDRHHLHTLTIMAGQAAVAVTNAILSNRLKLFFGPNK
ncbi:GAF domain-containing protein [Desulfofalx alkaliphila]|uniref:GAF domain-containing protein n=1 Tax=Desulfofalx alkaliphila TaxID=105483 RepID=UPI0012FEB367|nr:GAF domain-containing protein [Desulfofalx alkaliphila]